MNPYEAMEYDKRTFLQLLFDMLRQEHIIFNMFFYKSIIDPLWVRLISFYFELSLMFALNALFFSDDYIDARADLPKDVRVKYFL